VSAGQFSRRTFLTTTGAATAGATVATSLPTPARAAPADSTAAPADSTAAVITNIYPADPDAFVYSGRRYVGTDRDQAPLGANDFVMTDWYDLAQFDDRAVRVLLDPPSRQE
jgi:hypothetical protein